MTQPLMIVGAPRSGNTLVRRVLLASGQIYIPPETYVLGELIERWKRWIFLSWRERVWLFCAYFDRHPHWLELDLDSLTTFANHAQDLPSSEQNLHALLDQFYKFMAKKHGFTQSRWGDKTPWNTMHLRAIARFYPKAQYLWLVRDGRDSIASQIKADMRDLEQSAERWVTANQQCRRHLPKSRSLLMRYEDIAKAPYDSFSKIFKWAGLEFSANHLTDIPARLGDVSMRDHHSAVLRPISSQSIGNWTKSLTENQIDALPDSFHKMMRDLKYP